MMRKDKISLETLTWRKIRKDVLTVNPTLVKIIDNCDPDDSFTIYRVKYPYGETVFNKGVLHIPNSDGALVPITHHSISRSIKEQLMYRVIPMTFILKNSIESFAETENRVIPLTVFCEGRFAGAWETLDPLHSYFIKMTWNLTSGARSIFLLPKVSDASGYSRLQKDYSVRLNAAKQIKDHWQIFKAIANSSIFPTPWHCELLFFSKKWFDELQKDNSWLEFQNYLLKTSWRQSMLHRFLMSLNLVWQQFAVLVKYKGIHCGSYQLETLKHLIAGT